MADSRRSRPADDRAHDGVGRAVADLLAQALPDGGHVGVALSGGRDSIALLDAASRVAHRAGIALVAFHVHHGLSPNADRWSLFCREACAARNVAFASRHICVPHDARVSVEAAARKLRYDALAALARTHAVDAVLLGHHADDQAETVLLQLLRGAGPRGLAAMPGIAVDRGVRWLRPLLGITREALDAYVARRGFRRKRPRCSTSSPISMRAMLATAPRSIARPCARSALRARATCCAGSCASTACRRRLRRGSPRCCGN
jgi:tRNA(Ile)-lysidine synthetase-like protein